MSDPYLYANVVAVLLVICSELRTLFIPRAWQYDFPIAVFEQWCEVILTDNFEF
ncbi:hypothetical protein EJ04DRAFT_507911 [Polyplosphaeria fusca]|uniref:Uncharacterized protein n=1 Tax=Polyplosphaeria fusca TaxID=682080 RepID=A0A9P4RBT4_9PLEO|nr:hypothetical protein EJ04DRAFT_507911 [Polyplosphaeria fusca]